MTDIEKTSDTTRNQDHVEELSKNVDTVHKDEAMKVLVAYDGDQSWTDDEEKKLRRKIDWKLMPILCFTYSLQYYDNAMLGQAVSYNTQQAIYARLTFILMYFLSYRHSSAYEQI